MAIEISRVDACRCLLGEGAIWDHRDQSLLLLDIGRQSVVRYDPASDRVTRWQMPMNPGTVALRAGGGAIVGMRNTVAALDLASGEVTALATAEDQPDDAVFNDGKVDRQGRYVIGSCASGHTEPRPIGGILSFAEGRVRRLAGGISFSNGPCFSPDGRTLYFADSADYALYAYPYDTATGDLGERRLFFDTRPLGGMPDGATVDAEGTVWLTIFRGGKVAAIRPDGRLERVVELPVKLTVSPAFGGPNLDRLFVATIDPTYFDEPAEEGAGFLYVVDGLGVQGLPEPLYAG
jgi:sugar lactone lactonase YvrE